MGKTGVETAYSLALSTLSDGLQLDPTNLAKTFLRKKDKRRLAESEYKCTEGAKKLCRLARSKRKRLDDQHQQREGVVYASGAFDAGDSGPGPSKTLGVKPSKTLWIYLCISSKTLHCSYWCYMVLGGKKNWLLPKMCYFDRRTHVSLFYKKKT